MGCLKHGATVLTQHVVLVAQQSTPLAPGQPSALSSKFRSFRLQIHAQKRTHSGVGTELGFSSHMKGFVGVF